MTNQKYNSSWVYVFIPVSIFLLVVAFLNAFKIDAQKEEIHTLTHKVDSLEFKIYLDSIPIRVEKAFNGAINKQLNK